MADELPQTLTERFADVLIGPTTVIGVVDDPVQVVLVDHLVVDEWPDKRLDNQSEKELLVLKVSENVPVQLFKIAKSILGRN